MIYKIDFKKILKKANLVQNAGCQKIVIEPCQLQIWNKCFILLICRSTKNLIIKFLFPSSQILQFDGSKCGCILVQNAGHEYRL